MKKIQSPLRYPGGKAKLAGVFEKLLTANQLKGCVFAEPYAGGCGVGLSLLQKGLINLLEINDSDYNIYAFWFSILNSTEEFINLINATPVTVEQWRNQRDIYLKPQKKVSVLEKGFATFFLNRCNRSGIIEKAGIIGGYSQTGKWKIDARFNKPLLIERIRNIASHSEQINVRCMDALDFLESWSKSNREDRFVFLDPPYYEKGKELYSKFYKPFEHTLLANQLAKAQYPWALTYDNANMISNLYAQQKRISFNLNYSIAKNRIAKELFIIPHKIACPDNLFCKGA